jgi:alpha-glucuronidase
MTMLKPKLILPLALLPSVGQTALGQAAGFFLVSKGQPQAVIIAAKSQQYDFSTHELEHYLEVLSGAPGDCVSRKAQQQQRDFAFIPLGGLDANDLTKGATSKGLVQLDGLKRAEFVLRGCEFDGRHALVVAGNDEASTMYAVYELIERLNNPTSISTPHLRASQAG